VIQNKSKYGKDEDAIFAPQQKTANPLIVAAIAEKQVA